MIKNKYNFYRLEPQCIFIVKTITNAQVTRFVKISFDFKEYNKEKSKCAICLIERTFIHEIEEKFDLEGKVKDYPTFFTNWCYKRTGTLIVWGVER